MNIFVYVYQNSQPVLKSAKLCSQLKTTHWGTKCMILQYHAKHLKPTQNNTECKLNRKKIRWGKHYCYKFSQELTIFSFSTFVITHFKGMTFVLHFTTHTLG